MSTTPPAPYSAQVSRLRGELASCRDQVQDKLEGEDRQMKEISKMMAELEEEIVRYHSERTSTKYKNIQERMSGRSLRLWPASGRPRRRTRR